jgi:hypothetical protein
MPCLTRRIALLAIVTMPLPALAQAAQEPPKRIAASSFATVAVHLNARPIGRRWYEEDASLTGPARISISYGQPHARGRKIVGGLIPKDTVWRFGANEATTLHTDLDITIGGFDVPRGDYTLFLLNSGTTWQLIVNNRTGIWGTDRDANHDIGRVSLTAATKSDNEETLTIYLVPDSADPTTGYASLSGKLRIRWGTVELSTNWSVKQ